MNLQLNKIIAHLICTEVNTCDPQSLQYHRPSTLKTKFEQFQLRMIRMFAGAACKHCYSCCTTRSVQQQS